MLCVTGGRTESEPGMNLTREELQNAGASPELARLLADRLPRRGTGDLTRNPMAVAVAGIVLAAFLSTLGWLVLSTNGTQTDVALLGKDVAHLRTDVAHLKEGQADLEGRMIRIEDKLDRLLQE